MYYAQVMDEVTFKSWKDRAAEDFKKLMQVFFDSAMGIPGPDGSWLVPRAR